MKNDVELAGARSAHEKDGVALTRFFAWLAREGPTGRITEVSAAERLDAFRAEESLFRDVSFPTISGAGPNGAIVHYRATARTDRRLALGMLYLVDSGAQYLDGTTDVTRTLAIGPPTAEQRDRFTRVLRGHIALAMARFPKGTTGSQLDALARAPLWDAGLDFDHGTGHGVGSYLSVHEGPQRISKIGNSVALRPGMIVSNEPGYYKTGAYGIRIESLVVVAPLPTPSGGEVTLYGFETLTLAPIDRALVDPALLTPAEIAWLDAYHARVREAIAPKVDAETAAWLAEATRPLARSPSPPRRPAARALPARAQSSPQLRTRSGHDPEHEAVRRHGPAFPAPLEVGLRTSRRSAPRARAARRLSGRNSARPCTLTPCTAPVSPPSATTQTRGSRRRLRTFCVSAT